MPTRVAAWTREERVDQMTRSKSIARQTPRRASRRPRSDRPAEWAQPCNSRRRGSNGCATIHPYCEHTAACRVRRTTADERFPVARPARAGPSVLTISASSSRRPLSRAGPRMDCPSGRNRGQFRLSLVGAAVRKPARFPGSTRRWHSPQTTVEGLGREEDDILAIPVASTRERPDRRDLVRGAPGWRHPLELTVREKGKRLPIRRPERRTRALGAGQRAQFRCWKVPHVDPIAAS